MKDTKTPRIKLKDNIPSSVAYYDAEGNIVINQAEYEKFKKRKKFKVIDGKKDV